MLHSEGLKKAWTSSPSFFLRFLSFARGQYPRTAPTRKIQNLSHFLKVYQRVEIYYLAFLHAATHLANARCVFLVKNIIIQNFSLKD